MITNIRHFGLYVTDLNKTIDFYTKLGFKVCYRNVEDWGDIFGILDVVKLELNSQKIEFISDGRKHKSLKDCHLCFEVDDLEEFFFNNKLAFKFCPRPSPDKSVFITFAKDCNGLLLEFVEVLK